MVNAKSVSRGIMTNWLALAVNIAVSFFLAPFVVKQLGSAYYGIWALTMQFTGYLYLLDFGVRESVVRYTSKYVARKQQHRLNQILTTALFVYLPIIGICLLLTAVSMWGVPHWFDMEEQYWFEARLAVMFVGLTITQTFVFNVFSGIQLGLRQFGVTNLIGIVLTLVRTALIVFFLSRGAGLVALAAIQFAVAIAGGFVALWMALKLLRRNDMRFKLELPRGRRRTALSKRIFGYGWYVLVNNIGQKIIFASDAIIVGLFLPLSAVTHYAIAGSLVDYLRMLLTSTAQVFNPLSSHLFTTRQHTELAKMLVMGAKLTVLISLPIGVTYIVLGSRFIGLWMGPEFIGPSGQVLAVLALTQILSAPHNVISSVLYGISQHRGIAMMRISEGVINLALSIVLVQYMGLLGVAIGTAVSHILVVLVWLPRLICRTVGLSLWAYFMGVYGRCIVAVVPFVAAAWLVERYVAPNNLLNFFAWVALITAFYLATVYLIALTSDERKWVQGFISRRSKVHAAA